MKDSHKDSILYSVINGEIIVNVLGDEYIIKVPTEEIYYRATKIYNDTIENCRFENWLTDTQCKGYLTRYGMISLDIDKNLTTIEKTIEDTKLKMFEAMINKPKLTELKKTMVAIKNKYGEMTAKRHMLDHVTVKGYANMVKQQYIFSSTVYKNNKRLWEDHRKADTYLLDKIMQEYNKTRPSSEELRYIARNDPWRSMWGAGKPNPIGVPSTKLSNDQIVLYTFSKMYDNIYESPECPSEWVIEDDDILDGWIISQRRKQDKEKKEADIEARLPKNTQDAGEVFIVVDKTEEHSSVSDQIADIHSMNDIRATMVKKQREAVIKQKGEASQLDFPDTKLDLMTKANKQFTNQVKGNK